MTEKPFTIDGTKWLGSFPTASVPRDDGSSRSEPRKITGLGQEFWGKLVDGDPPPCSKCGRVIIVGGCPYAHDDCPSFEEGAQLS